MNVKNRTIFTRDNLEVMRGMKDECIDLIYLDPPFNSNADYSAPVGSEAAGAEFKDTWSLSDIDKAWHGEIADEYPGLYELLTATRTIHSNSMMSYLIYMVIRVMEMRRILKETGSIYLHCDPTASHYLKLMMDEIFGKQNFQNEIIWRRTSSHNRAKKWGPIHDVILYYSVGINRIWNRELQPLEPEYVEKHYQHKDKNGKYQVDNLTGPGQRDGDTGQEWRGINPTLNDRHWELPPDRALPDWFKFPHNYSEMTARERLEILNEQGLIYWPKKSGGVPRFKRYLTARSGASVQDIVTDIKPLFGNQKETTGYPTQKPVKLIQRIIRASSNEGDIILDPFCGCATACVAAEIEHRQWIGIDVSSKAYDLVKARLEKEVNVGDRQMFGEVIHRTDIPTERQGKKSKKIKHIRYGEQEGRCNGCLELFPFKNMTEDHKVPKARGGADTDDNIQLLCNWCNSKKGSRLTHDELVAILIEEGVRK